MNGFRFARRLVRSQYEFSVTRRYKTVFSAILLSLFPVGIALADLVGTMPGQFSVSNTGDANYTIPITAPAATGGMKPNLSLSYSHRGGNGIAGQGWTVQGLSTISRCRQTLVHDGDGDGIHYNLEDRFCLDGQRLVLTSGTYGDSGSEYRTEVDNFSRIVASGSQGTGQGAGPQSFIITDRNGIQNFYGHLNNSSLGGLANTYGSWAQYATVDTFQNKVEYFYNVPTLTGEHTLDRIEYTANLSQGLSPRYKVLFEYLDRPDSDKRSGFTFGVIWSKDRRLTKISIQNLSAASAWETIHDYTLDYVLDTSVVSGRSQLASVQQCRGTTCLPKTTFDWQNAIASWDTEVSSGQSSIGHTSMRAGDFNGDGQHDLYVINSGEWHVLLASGGSFSNPIDTNKASSGSPTHLLDFNGDGKMDLLFAGSDSKWHVYQSTGDESIDGGFTEIITTVSTVGIDAVMAQDGDGDGRGDMFYRSGSAVYRRKSTGADFESTATLMMNTIATSINFTHPGTASPDRQVDFDGDGRGDIMLREKTVTSGGGGRRGGGGSTTTYEYVAYKYNDFGYTFYGALDGNIARYFVDINGDGLDDVAYYSGSSWRHVISKGNGFEAESSSSILDSNSTKVVFADYDGDGRDDLIRATSTEWLVHKSNGDGFDSVGISVGGPDPLNSQVIAMDVSGSGFDELVMSYSNLWQVRNHKSSAVDVVTKFTDGLGNFFQPILNSVAGMADYLGTVTGTFPVRRFSDPFYVVDSYSANDGIGGTYSIDYQYWDAMQHTRGYGFLGFDVLEATDDRNSTIRRLEFAQEIPYLGMIDDSFFKQPDTIIIRRNNPTLSYTQFGTFPNIRYFVRAESLTSESFEVGGILNGQQVKKVVQVPVYDSTYGNITSNVITTTSAQAPGDTYTTTLTFQYDNYTSPWCLGLPTQTQITRSAPGATTKSRTDDRTFNSINCRLITSTNVSEVNAGLQLSAALTYDAYGNVKTATRDSADGAAADRKTELYYDSWGHLPTSTKAYIDNLPDPSISEIWDYKLLRPTSKTDIRGQITSWEYDEFGRVTKETRPDLTVLDTAYVTCIDCWVTGRGRFYVENTDSDGSIVRDYRDWIGRSIGGWKTLPTGTQASFQTDYDQDGRITRHYMPWVTGEPNFYADLSYDLLGRVTQENRPIDELTPSGAITAFTYQGLTSTATNAENQTIILKVDPLSRIEETTDDLSGVVLYEYTVFDELNKTWDADTSSHLTTINYNDRGDKISMTSPDRGTWIYDWNVFGQQSSQTDAKSQTTDIVFNQLGLPSSRTEDEGTTTWSYFSTTDSKLWLPSSVTSPGGFAESYSYDSLSRRSSVTTTIDAVNYSTDLSYHTTGSGKGKLQRITYPTSTAGIRFKADYEYDQWGELSTIKNGDSPSTVFYVLNETDAFGRERLATLGNGIDEDRVYDRANGLLQTIISGPNLSATIQDLSYQWDDIGNLTERQDLNQSKTEIFTYDGLNRIKDAKLNAATTLTVNYNSGGNITFKSDVGTYTYGASAGPHAVTEITGLRPATYSYDANGNMTNRDGDAITWTSYDKPIRIDYGVSDYAEFLYGPDRNRFKQTAVTGGSTATTHYVGGNFEKESVGGFTSYRHHVLADGRTVAIHTRPTSGAITTKYLHRDHLGSVVALTDENGSVDQEFSFDAFGKRRNTDWTADTGDLQFAVSHGTEQGYTGHEHLDNVRLVHMNGRVQDPIIGRMISADPFIPNPFNSQSFNRYSYVVNNPMSLVDPSGFMEHHTDRVLCVEEGCRDLFDPFDGGFDGTPTPRREPGNGGGAPGSSPPGSFIPPGSALDRTFTEFENRETTVAPTLGPAEETAGIDMAESMAEGNGATAALSRGDLNGTPPCDFCDDAELVAVLAAPAVAGTAVLITAVPNAMATPTGRAALVTAMRWFTGNSGPAAPGRLQPPPPATTTSAPR